MVKEKGGDTVVAQSQFNSISVLALFTRRFYLEIDFGEV